jgi:protein-S-isoprenylcysteine O-methyltransferase Ste14
MQKKADAKTWDMFFNRLYTILGLTIMVIAGFDVGFFHITPSLPLGLKIILIILILPIAGFADWAVLVNRFYSRIVRIQKDRGHHVVNKGPYRVLRHPTYLFALINLIIMPVLLNSFIAYIPSLLCVVLMVWRTYKEDTTLKNELEGYLEYSKKVKYRLIPGLF